MGKTIHSGERNMILKVMEFFEREKKNKMYIIPIDNVIKRTCEATGVSKRTIMRIKNEFKKLKESSALGIQIPEASTSATSHTTLVPRLTTPRKKRCPSNKINVDSFTICAIRNIISNFYVLKKEVPTLKKILATAKLELKFQGQKETLRKLIINKLGYKFKKCRKSREFLIEKPEIAAWRARYLRRLKENDELGINKKPVIYIDETWIHSHYTVNKCWQNEADAGVKKNEPRPTVDNSSCWRRKWFCQRYKFGI
ncbi:unnamed protein product [Euphydryas editha]|uniref:Transposase n=1 Tax=Euphydryas editha TaxID=104508 RepID=A0AAU9TZ10_EUPED|nr:unnamed protein product [Euphydryas editha]